MDTEARLKRDFMLMSKFGRYGAHAYTDVVLNPQDILINTYSEIHGGHLVPVADTGVTVKHLPTGIAVSCNKERSAHANRALAMLRLRFILTALVQMNTTLWEEETIASLKPQVDEVC